VRTCSGAALSLIQPCTNGQLSGRWTHSQLRKHPRVQRGGRWPPFKLERNIVLVCFWCSSISAVARLPNAPSHPQPRPAASDVSPRRPAAAGCRRAAPCMRCPSHWCNPCQRPSHRLHGLQGTGPGFAVSSNHESIRINVLARELVGWVGMAGSGPAHPSSAFKGCGKQKWKRVDNSRRGRGHTGNAWGELFRTRHASIICAPDYQLAGGRLPAARFPRAPADARCAGSAAA